MDSQLNVRLYAIVGYADGKKIKYDLKYNKPLSPRDEQEFIEANTMSGGSVVPVESEDFTILNNFVVL